MTRYIPGTDPLAARYHRYTAAERDELVARVRAATEQAQRRSGLAKTGTTISPKRLAELRAARAAEREQARAAARALRVAEGVAVPTAPRRPAKARRAPPVDPPIAWWLLPTGPARK